MRRLLLLVLVSTLLLGACGGDDGDSDDVAARSTTTESEATPAGTDEDGEEADDEDFSGKGSGDFCDKSRRYTEKFEDVAAAFGDPEESKKHFEALEDAIEDIAEDAPGEIEADFEVVVQNFKDVKALFEEYDYRISDIPEDESAALDDPEAEAANERVEAYMKKVCGIDQGGDTSTEE